MFKELLTVLLCFITLNCLAQPASTSEKSTKTGVTKIPQVELKNLMTWMIDPAADAIWDSVATIIDRKGTREIKPQDDAQWESLLQQAMVLTEAGNLLLMPERTRPGKIWVKAANKLRSSGNLAVQATLKKDTALLFKAGEEIYKSCSGCHNAYTKFESTRTTPVIDTPTNVLAQQSAVFSTTYQLARH